MRITIEIDGERIAAHTDAGSSGPSTLANFPRPGPAPAALLARAKELGALSAGAAGVGIRADAATATAPPEAPPPRAPIRKRGTKRAPKS